MSHDECREADLQWLRDACASGQLSDDARRVFELAQREIRELEEFHHLQFLESDRIHRERCQRLEVASNYAYGVGLNCRQKYARWLEKLDEHLLLVTSGPEEIERFKADLVRRIEDHRARTKWRRTRGRKINALSYHPEYRRQRVEEYIRLRQLGVPQEIAAHRVVHALKTLRKWAEELEINFI